MKNAMNTVKHLKLLKLWMRTFLSKSDLQSKHYYMLGPANLQVLFYVWYYLCIIEAAFMPAIMAKTKTRTYITSTIIVTIPQSLKKDFNFMSPVVT